jgi:phenylacetate-CoA ligase
MPSRTPLEPWIAAKIGAGTRGVTRRELEEFQLQKLRESIRWARSQSPFYAKHLNGHSEAELTSLNELQRLPFTDADDIKKNGLQFLCVSQGDIDRVVTLESSGTSGKPKRVYFTAEDQELTTDFFEVGMSTLIHPGQTVLIALPGERPGSVGNLLARALERLRAKPVPCGFIHDPAAVLGLIARERIDCVVGLPVQIFSLVRSAEDLADAPTHFPSRVLLCSDHVPESIVRAIKHAWRCEVFEHYGMTEMGLGGGVDCEAHCGYHLREADLLFEIVDTQTGERVGAGQEGEVVFTTLTRRGMPLIRYRTGDISRFLPEACPCGTTLGRLDRIRGRKNASAAIGEAARISMATLDDALFAVPHIQEFSAIVYPGPTTVLQITAFTCGTHDDVVRRVRTALGAVPAIQCAERSGDLQLDLRIASHSYVPSGRKRMIVQEVA